MSDDYWSSPEAAHALGFMGKQAGLREGHQQGFNNGFEQGRNQGFQEGSAAMQERMEATIAKLRAEINELREFSNGAVVVLDAAMEALAAGGNEKQMAGFIVSYGQRAERSVSQKHIPLAPNVDERFMARMPRVAQIINETLVKYLRR
jgi:hypothetical protein